MAKITINIPVGKEDWVMDGLALRFGYQETVDNPDFDHVKPVDPDANPLKVPNPETKVKFAKRMVIHMIKDNANTGHNQVSLDANAVIANDVTLT